KGIDRILPFLFRPSLSFFIPCAADPCSLSISFLLVPLFSLNHNNRSPFTTKIVHQSLSVHKLLSLSLSIALSGRSQTPSSLYLQKIISNLSLSLASLTSTTASLTSTTDSRVLVVDQLSYCVFAELMQMR
ncbi:hypothetical protein CFOL_v3_19204, partial [Cephalotus follicularis]